MSGESQAWWRTSRATLQSNSPVFDGACSPHGFDITVPTVQKTPPAPTRRQRRRMLRSWRGATFWRRVDPTQKNARGVPPPSVWLLSYFSSGEHLGKAVSDHSALRNGTCGTTIQPNGLLGSSLVRELRLFSNSFCFQQQVPSATPLRLKLAAAPCEPLRIFETESSTRPASHTKFRERSVPSLHCRVAIWKCRRLNPGDRYFHLCKGTMTSALDRNQRSESAMRPRSESGKNILARAATQHAFREFCRKR